MVKNRYNQIMGNKGQMVVKWSRNGQKMMVKWIYWVKKGWLKALLLKNPILPNR